MGTCEPAKIDAIGKADEMKHALAEIFSIMFNQEAQIIFHE